MKLSRKFVSDYIDLDKELSIKQIAEDMTSVGNEYDDASKLINCTNLITGEVIECTNHPDSDHLHCCKVDIGTEVLDIVCGAPNVREGLKVIVAKSGAKLPGGEIKKGVIRGAESNGMLCSISELGIDNKFLTDKDRDGICELPSDTKIGIDPVAVLGLDDEVIDFELTSNRGDLLSILGMAYELGAIYDKKVKDIELSYTENDENIKDSFSIEVMTPDCPMFLVKKVIGVKVGESPEFIKNRLITSGIRPINNVVDISNYVMLETGQPLHFYDAKRLGNKLVVRNAAEGEKLITLDGEERVLSGEDIVIANNAEAVGLAGVMGGLSTEVENDTTDIIIESAIFDSVKIRKTSKKILRSEASNRFEKGLDPKRTYMAIERSCHLLEKYASAKVVGGTLEYNTLDIHNKMVDITVEKINKVLGISITKEEVISIFDRLGFTTNEKDNYLTVEVPTRRIDIAIEEDLIEEVGRIYGMDKIVGKLPVLSTISGKYNKTRRAIKHKLADLGLNETLSYSLISRDKVKLFTSDNFEEITLNDPMSEDRNTLRYSLLSSLFDIYNYNKARNNSNISIFEIGESFYREEGLYKEDTKLAVLMAGEYNLGINKEVVDFYYIKGVLEELMYFLGYNGRYSLLVNDKLPKELHPGSSAVVNVNGTDIGIVGKLHPSVTKDNIYVLELNLTKLLSIRTGAMKYKEISKFPGMIKDVAFIVDNNTTSQEVETVIKKAGGRLLTDIQIFDLFPNIEEGKKSMAYKLTFKEPSRTLTEEEVMEIFNKIILDVENKLNAKLRG